ncbi:glycosyltransferase [Planktothrix agardhii 1806]|jgi:GT2 family glycosyltransferase|uniref:Glycosyl transferase, group 2 family protein n=1 Tax=Planktothrix agardhii TaxID=1160 RepID=A0A1J1JJ79_PLAAG|nr:glycosyltransferase [Planktothrix agardhii]MCF3569052.1 glycosyltransferase [Planktothrix agardhii 1807]MCF3569507.1 glycosyltransferase [Planktothrix agardhii 1805]MCF3577121.1 glycosyltransferase [Planktothrix agardhii 1812]MCF3579608.1 glycosyltransferase [Planktothrix agardhii 1811]MCF3583523.1 glycosyltransferase [Planktothrix agardhii 1803]
MPVISVIIPVYNGEKTIRETVISVLNQTFSDFELIIINDGSTDSTLDVVSTIYDSRLKVFSYPNGNLSASRNRGISHANGEYIAFIDADDLWTPDKLEAQYKALQDHPETAVAYSWTNCIDESSQFLRCGSHKTVNGDAYPNLLVVNILESGSNPLICRKALEKVGEFDSSLTPAEDWDMWLRLAKHYPFITVPKPQILYRQSSQSLSANVLKLEAGSKQVIEQAFSQAPDSLQSLKKKSLGNIYKYLTFKALEGKPNPKQGLVAFSFLYNILINDPTMLRRKTTLRTLLKIATFILFPQRQAEWILSKFGKISNIGALMMYIKTDIN